MKRTINIWQGVDKFSILLFLILVFLGWLNIYAAVYNEEANDIFDFSQRYGKQFIWIVAAMLIAIFVLLIDIRFYFFFSWIIYGAVVIMLLVVLVVAEAIYGARSWFEIGGLGIQPSEFAKFATALALAAYLNSKRQELTKLRVFIPALAIILLPTVLILLQPDMGSALVFFSLIFVLFREGMSPYIFVSGLLAILLFLMTLLIGGTILSLALVTVGILLLWIIARKWKLFMTGTLVMTISIAVLYLLDKFVIKSFGSEMAIIAGVILSGIIFTPFFLKKKAPQLLVVYFFLVGSLLFINSVDYGFNHLLKPHQKERVEILLGSNTDLHGTGYNLNQSLISIGSGGLTGKGFLQGTQTKFKFVPKQSSDFIFCTVGEEWGFIGSLVVILIYVTLFLRLIFLAERQRSAFSRIYGYGVVSVLFFHFFINIGMAIGIVPTIGIPLPFLSYGGSSLWGFTILLFIFLRLDASRSEYLI
ncbi:MAG TPA: rod shape-determining protein RodA [Bacteroidales bacterium]|nr:rod shape-determining protein RodA [Bacteroidales bacterium]